MCVSGACVKKFLSPVFCSTKDHFLNRKCSYLHFYLDNMVEKYVSMDKSLAYKLFC